MAAGAAREFVHPGIAESAEDIARAGRRAYDLALMYRLTDDERYAAKAVEFINANSHYESLDERGSGPLDYGKIYLLVEAAELLRLRSSGWGTLMERRLSNEK